MNTTALNQIWTLMSEAGYTAVLLRTRANFAWIIGGRDNHIENASEYGIADLVIFADHVVCMTLKMESKRIMEEELYDLDVEMITPEWIEGTEGALAELLQGLIVASDSPYQSATMIATELSSLRRVLSPFQIKQYREVSTLAAETIEQVAKQLCVGMTEFEIAAMMSATCVRQGCSPHVTLVATDERILNYRHPIPTSKKLERYAMLVICAEKYGLIANATRFVHFGDLPADVVENKQKCAYIDVRMNAATRPGTRVSEVFQTALSAYREIGLAEDWRLLHLGGPTGYASREYLANGKQDDIIEVHQAYTWNPALWGIKSEDTILVGETANEFMTHTGNWPYLQVLYEGRMYERPDVLIRSL